MTVNYEKAKWLHFKATQKLASKVQELEKSKKEQGRTIASLKEENEKLKSDNEQMKSFLCEKFPEASFCP